MEDDWESAAMKPIVVIPDNINKWAGEDDDEDVKDSWDIEEEEKKDEEKSETIKTRSSPAKTKPNKALKTKLAEQERLEEEAEAARLANMTPEEKLAEKLRMQKILEESDLKSALETFGVTDVGGELDAFNPQTEEEFKEFGATLSWKLAQYKELPHFYQFVEDLVRSIGVHLSLSDLKKLKISVENLHTEKLKLEKQNSKKPSSKAKGKVTLKKESDDIDGYKKYGDDYGTYDDDYDDFM